MNVFQMIDHPDVIPTFGKDGYVVVKKILGRKVAKGVKEEIVSKIESCAKQLACTPKEYLSAVSRWADPSIVTSAVWPDILERITQVTQSFTEKPVQLKKMNVICKNAYCTGSIAYHQDISYSPQDPYEFSLWIALDDIGLGSSPLEVIPGSHLLPLKSAVDFWSPHYQPDLSFRCCAIKLVVEAGDAIIFDSRLWHGSGENRDLSSRYALVIRWVREGWAFPQPIPAIKPDFFGLWTSGDTTNTLLSQGLKILFQKSAIHFVDLLDIWMQLIQEKPLPFEIHRGKALQAFQNLKILHLAYTHHNGGDATGTVYRTFWEVFLSSLEKYMTDIEKKRTVG